MYRFNKKQFILICLPLILCLGLFGCTEQSSKDINNKNTNTDVNTDEIDTSGWKIYRNEDYGFEFKYPRNIGSTDFNFSERKETEYFRDVGLYQVGFWPMGAQDLMMGIIVLPKDEKDIFPQMLPPKKQQDYKSYEKKFKVLDKEIVGYADNLLINDNLLFINYQLLAEGQNYNYYINAGFFKYINYCLDENHVSCYDVVDNVLKTFKTF